eukprot:5329150-Amphidinium_carterae.4
MKEEDEIKYWRQMWKDCERGLSLSLEASTPRDSFFDRKMRAILAAKEDKYRMFDSYLIQRFPLNEPQKSVRGSRHYDPTVQWNCKNLIGTLALSPQRELAWTTMRTLIRSTPSPTEAEEQRREQMMHYDDLVEKMIDFPLQYHGDERDIRGVAAYQQRAACRDQMVRDHLEKIIRNRKLSVVELQYRLVSLQNDAIFSEQVVQWWHAIGTIILPRLRERRVIDHDIHALPQLLAFLYTVMTTVYMKDISHLGAMGQYGDDGAAYEERSEQIHVTDFGNKLYAQVIRDGSLPNYSDITRGFTEEEKGDVLETMMGLNFLEKEHRLTLADIGITSLDDAQETMVKVEWYTFRRGLEWSLAYFQDCNPITAIVAMREACSNYIAYIGDRGMTLNPVMRSRRCLGCGKKRNNAKRREKITCYPRLFQSLKDHLESDEGCVQDFIQGVGDLRFTQFYNPDEVMEKWWKRRKRAFVVYLTESGHRQWPVGGIWDLEVMACALSGVFSTLVPLLITRLENGGVTIKETRKPRTDEKPVVLEHFSSLLNPRIPWWTDCDFPAECSSELDEQWSKLDRMITEQMDRYPAARANSQQKDSNMPVMYRELRAGIDERIKMVATQPNYGRGIPVLVSGYDLSPFALTILGIKGRTVGREEIHTYKTAVLRDLEDPELTKKYIDHIAATTKFLATIVEEGEGVGGVLATTPAQEPQIIEQAKRKVGVTLKPGPLVTSREFEDVDLVLVDKHASRVPVREVYLDGNVVLNTQRVRGIAVKNPRKTQRGRGPQSAFVPADTVDKTSVHVDYLQAKGIASEGAIRYPTHEFYQERFLVPGNHPLSEEMERGLEQEAVDVRNRALNRVAGLWTLIGYTLRDGDSPVTRHRKLVEVGAEGPPRRASLVRKDDPSRFIKDKWNGSPECLTISHKEYRLQYWYKDREGHFENVTDPEALREMRLGSILLADLPTNIDCRALDRACGPCGGTYGQLFPCMLCENWTHMGCSYGVEGGRVCASHVAVLDAEEGIAVIISDPTDRLVGTIVRPTRLLSTTPKHSSGRSWKSTNRTPRRMLRAGECEERCDRSHSRNGYAREDSKGARLPRCTNQGRNAPKGGIGGQVRIKEGNLEVRERRIEEALEMQNLRMELQEQQMRELEERRGQTKETPQKPVPKNKNKCTTGRMH